MAMLREGWDGIKEVIDQYRQDDRTDDIRYRDSFAEQQRRNEHREDERCALEHIRRAEFDALEHLLPQHSIDTDNRHSACEPQPIPPRHRRLQRRFFRAYTYAGVEHVDAHQGYYIQWFNAHNEGI